MFLQLDRFNLAASLEDKYKTFIRIFVSDMSADELRKWIRKNVDESKSSAHGIIIHFRGFGMPDKSGYTLINFKYFEERNTK